MKSENHLKKESEYFMICSPEGDHSPALTKAEGKNEYCVTVSTNRQLVTIPNWQAKSINGRELLTKIPRNIGILIVSNNDGRYLSPKDLEKLREI
ncbi:hypothetical protein [Thalassolituus sp.]|jgi:hypothetical protein|uniref:hypothetical protein n=1 Tax=Thalassolituus sp. TaxID=2030822 RepID=UPI0032D8E850